MDRFSGQGSKHFFKKIHELPQNSRHQGGRYEESSVLSNEEKLGVTVQNSVAMVTWRPVFVHPALGYLRKLWHQG